jgi:DNA-binding MarR family transcriptional regulator
MVNNSAKPNSAITASTILDTITRVLNKAAAIEKEPVDIGHGLLLYASEVHLIDMAGRYPEEGISQTASRPGITKGAVSQTAKKLEEKGYIERTNPEGDRKTVFIRLTERGMDAFLWHTAYHEAVNQNMAEQVEKLSPRDIDNLFSILLRMETMLDNCPVVRNKITAQFIQRSLQNPDKAVSC